MKILGSKHDTIANAVYVSLSNQPVAYTKEIDENRNVDYDHNGLPVGVEFLAVSEGIDTDDLPEMPGIEHTLEGLGLKMLA